MPLPLLFAAGAGLVGAIGNVIGGAIQAGSLGEASNLLRQAMEEYGPEILPKVQAELKGYGIRDSDLAKVTGDAEAIAMQRRVLSSLADQAFAGPGDAQFSAELQRAQTQALSNFSNQQQAIQEQLRQRGVSGGVGVAAQQAAASQQANLMSQQGLDLSADAQRRKMQALQQLGSLSGQMRGQSFDERATAARANDELSRFNAQMKFNAQNQYDQQIQNEFARKMKLADSRAQILGQQAGIKSKQGDVYAGMAQAPFVAGAGFATTAGDYYAGKEGLGRMAPRRRSFYEDYYGGDWA